MKKVITLLLAVSLVTMSYAQTAYGFQTITRGANLDFLLTGMSNNGKYVAGWLGIGLGSALYDVDNDEFYLYDSYGSSEMDAVTDDGMLIGYGYSDKTLLGINLITGETIVDSSVYDLWGRDCNSDGSFITGTYITWRNYPCYWKDKVNECIPLSQPDAEEIEFRFIGDDDDPADWSYEYVEAIAASEDGSVICGNVYGWLLNGGALLWKLNESGEYDLYPICAGLVETEWEGTHPYDQYVAVAISANGKYLAMSIQDNDGTMAGGQFYIGRYDIDTGELETTSYEDNECSPASVANDGTIVGTTMVKGSYLSKALIWEKGHEPMLLADKYPLATGINDWDENEGNRCRKISSDGRFICGAGTYYFEGEGDTYSRYAGWLFDTEKYATAAGITTIDNDNTAPSQHATRYFSLDGRELPAPQPGINIVKTNTTSRKLLVK